MFPGRQWKQCNPVLNLLGSDLTPLPQRQHPLISVPCLPTPPLSWRQSQLVERQEFSMGCQVHEAALRVWMHRVSICTPHKSSLSLPSQLFKQSRWPPFQKSVRHFEQKQSAMKNAKKLPVLTKLSCCFLVSFINAHRKNCSAPHNSHVWDRAAVFISNLLLCELPSCPNAANHYHINSRFEKHFSFPDQRYFSPVSDDTVEVSQCSPVMCQIN